VETRLIEVTIRPPRIVTFINAKDPHWQDTVLRIIEIYSEIWGGAYDIIVPYEIKNNVLFINPVFEAILKKYDPDYIRSFPEQGVGTGDLTGLIDRCINPFENTVYNVSLSLNYLKGQCFYVQTPFDDNWLQLIVYSVLGKYKSSYEREFKKHTPKIRDIAKLFAKQSLFSFFRSSLSRRYPPSPLFQTSPFGGSLADLNLHLHQGPYFDPIYHPSIIVLGNSLYDFLLYYDLLRLNFGCVFIPKNLLESATLAEFRDYIRAIFDRYRHKEAYIASLSSQDTSENWEKIKNTYKDKIIAGANIEVRPNYILPEELNTKITESDPVQIYYSSEHTMVSPEENKLKLSLICMLKHPLEYLDSIVDLKPKQIKYLPKKLLNRIQLMSPSDIDYRISHSAISIKCRGEAGPIDIEVSNAFDIFSGS